MNNRVVFSVTPFREGLEGAEFVVQAEVNATGFPEKALIAVFSSRITADTFAAAMNNAMDLADGHPRANR